MIAFVYPYDYKEEVKVFTQKVSNLVLNIEFIIWPLGVILNRTHELSDWFISRQWNWLGCRMGYIIACTCAEP